MGDTIKSGRKGGFTVLYNSMIVDKRLSLKAKGLFAVIMSRPEDWEFSVSGLAAFTGVGKDSIRSTLAELERVGYLLRSQAHDSRGKFTGNIYILQDMAPPLSGNTDDGITRQRETTLSENPTQQKKDSKETKTNIPPVAPQGANVDMLFNRFWEAYPKKRSKQDAKKAWDKLGPDIALCRIMAEALKRQKCSAEWEREGGRFIPLPATWLRGRRWEDELDSGPGDEPKEEGRRYGWH